MIEVKKKQHYYPKFLLKHFSDKNGNVYTYNVFTKKFEYVRFDSICYHNYTYESEKTASKADNHLENQFAGYENRVAPIIDYIVNNYKYRNFKITKHQCNELIDYLFLQICRTDAGRLKIMNNIKYSWDYEKKGVVTNEEIKNGEKKIREFNNMCKNENGLENFLNIFEKESCVIKIGKTTTDLISSDNPVVGYLLTEAKSVLLFMPIAPNIVLICVDNKKKLKDKHKLVLSIPLRLVNWINHAIINTSNYTIISKKEFSVPLTGYIINRFENDNWEAPFEIVF